MSDDITYPFIPSDQLFARYESLFEGDYTKAWGHTMGLYHRKGVWCASIVLGRSCDPMGEIVSAACYGAAVGADQALWYACGETEGFMGDRYILALYADRWGSKAYRKRRVAIYDDGRVMGVGEWEDGPTDGRMLEALVLAWELDTIGDPSVILPLLRGRGHVVHSIDVPDA